MGDEERTIGRYRVVKELGTGGMSLVYLAFDPVRNEQVALKCMKKEGICKPLVRQQFLKEAKTLKTLSHPNIVTVYDIVEEPELVYFSMPFIEGKNLKHLIISAYLSESKGNKLQEKAGLEMAAIFMQILQAVAYGHSMQLLHRDLKPENVIVQPDGRVVILDWGLVTEYQEEATTKLPFEDKDSVAGTSTYLAPELCLREPPSLQTEVFSLGLIFYEMLTLRLPFHRDTLQEYAKQYKYEVLVDPMSIAPYRGCTPALAHIVLKCLAYKPEDRYESVEALLADLEAALKAPDPALEANRLFSEGHYSQALKEYERLRDLYPDTLIADEACLKAASCLLKAGKPKRALALLEELEGGMHALFKYLGRIEIFQELRDVKKELESFRALFERFFYHPLIERAKVALNSRVQGMSREQELAHSTEFLLLAYSYLPADWKLPEPDASLLTFMRFEEQANWSEEMKRQLYALQIAVASNSPHMLVQIVKMALKRVPTPLLIAEIALLGLGAIGAYEEANRVMDELWKVHLDVQAFAKLLWIKKALKIIQAGCKVQKVPFLEELPHKLAGEQLYPIFAILAKAKLLNRQKLIENTVAKLKGYHLSDEYVRYLSNMN